jgi:large subunit ribosomal protein L30
MAKKKVEMLRIELIRSVIGTKPNQRRTVQALGLRKINSSVERKATPVVMGMINTISHLVKVEEIK